MALTKILTEGIKDGEIKDVDVNTSAAIARTKLANVDVVDDTSPQLGGALQSNGNNIDFAEIDKARFGTDQDLQIYHQTNTNILGTSGVMYLHNTGASATDLDIRAQNDILLKPQNGEQGIKIIGDGAVELYYDGVKKIETTSSGVNVSGIQRNSSAGYNYLLIGSTDASGATLTLDGDSNGDGAGGDYAFIEHGTDGDLAIHCDNPAGDSQFELYVGNGSTQAIVAAAAGAVNLYHNGSQRFYTSTTGSVVTAGDTTLSIVGTNTNGYAQLKLQTTAGNNNNYLQSDHGLVMWINGANRAQFEPDGTFIVQDGNVKIATAGHGIDFSSTPAGVNGSSTSELFDDYEEGTFTPTFGGGVSASGYTNQYGFYTKIGREVQVYIYIRASSATTDTNSLRVDGLPYTCNNTAGHEGGGYITYTNGFFGTTVNDEHFHPMPWVAQGQTYVVFHTPGDGNNSRGVDTVPGNKYLIFHVRYSAAT